ncbi:unnamed protein product [Clonostachys solani]|uniref:DUF7730 domain-containing protein n=1 Tax=Clonostachys solani TaxID=160281 RepID=A0A9N9ZJD2_9HYPO|nr:unnamed protein product [Clonostachys solani]
MRQMKKTVTFRDIWIDRHRNGVAVTLARFALVTLVDILFIICRPFSIIIQLMFDALRSVFTRVQRHARRWHGATSNSGLFQAHSPEHLLQPIPGPAPINIKDNQTDSKPNGRFFSMLPPEVRRRILVHAFGRRTMHMHVKFQSPWALADAEPQDMAAHARLEPFIRHDQPQRWIWYGCVCHRSEPEDDPLSLGRTRSWPVKQRSYFLDGCLKGEGTCSKWPGAWPSKCQIGATGWLRTCRQAYVEGMEVLYRTNTIQIASRPLLRGLHDILPSTPLSLLTSLELVWHPFSLPVTEGFRGYRSQTKEKTILPSLIYLRICIVGLDLNSHSEFRRFLSELDPAVEPMEEVAPKQLEQFDMLVKRIAPASANVTISLENLPFYQAAEAHLIKKQGSGITRPQISELGGLKYWRQISMAEDKTLTPQRIEEGEVLSQALGGYWVHIAEEVVEGGISAPTVAGGGYVEPLKYQLGG